MIADQCSMQENKQKKTTISHPLLIKLVKEVPGGCHGCYFGVKVETVKLIGGILTFAAISGLNKRVYSQSKFQTWGVSETTCAQISCVFITQKL